MFEELDHLNFGFVSNLDIRIPLVVEKLACSAAAGLFGLWTYLPAYFCDLQVSACSEQDIPHGEKPNAAEDTVEAWFAEGYGVVSSPETVALGRCVGLS